MDLEMVRLLALSHSPTLAEEFLQIKDREVSSSVTKEAL